MRILIYSRVFAPLRGGIETVAACLAHGLAQAGAEVTVATATPVENGVTGSFPFGVVRQPGLWQLVQRMRQADVVHLAGPTLVPLLLALLARKPVVVEHHGFQAACPNGQMFYEPEQMPCPGHFMAGRHLECWRCNATQGRLRSLKMWLLTFVRRWLCRRVDVNIVPTIWLGEVLHLPQTTAIHHGISVAPHAGTPRPTGSPLTFAFLGRLVTTKGVGVLLDAAHQLRRAGASFPIRIIGDGPERKNLEERSRGLGLEDRVVFLGALDENRLEEALRDVDALVMPSLGGEVFGLVAAEFMGRGRAVVTSDLGALSEVVGDTGIRFPAGDSGALADCLRQLMSQPGLVARLGSRGRERASQFFRMETMIDKHLDIYRHWIR